MFAFKINWPLVVLLALAVAGLVIAAIARWVQRLREGKAATDSQVMVSPFIALAHQLDSLGYYRFVDRAEAERCIAEVGRTYYPWGHEATRRDFSADAEELAEGGAAEFIESLRPTLEQLGVRIGQVEDEARDVEGSTYIEHHLIVDGERSLIVSPYDEELGDELWALAAARTFGVVNRLLERAGSDERLYAIEGGNDLRGVILTEEVLRAVTVCNLFGTDELPYRLDESIERRDDNA